MINLKSFFKPFFLAFIIILIAPSSIADDDNYSPLDSPSFFEGLNTFTAVFSQIKQMYVDDIDDETLFNNAIRGLVDGLDPHSSFLEPIDQSKVSESTMGKFGGLGIVIGTKGDYIEVVSPIDDTPAYRAGLKAGDIILQIGDLNVSQINLEEGVKLMRGAPGTSIKLTIGRPDIAPFVVEITREIITITSAKGLLVEDGIGYLRIAQFQRPTAEVVEKIIADLVDKNEGNLDSLIIDLRNNPGGLLDSSIDISNLFIDEPGIVVYTEGRTTTSNVSFPTKPGDILNGAPIVVLMNVGSASASEIVAGALQDHKRAIIMGEESFGKGSVQSMMSLQDGYGLKLTTARYFTPSGRSIQAKGISPDIQLDNISLKNDDEEEESIDFSSQEKDLKNALSAEDEDEIKSEDPSDSTKKETLESQDEIKSKDPTDLTAQEILESQDKIAADRDQEYIDLLLEDYYVHEAMNVLKALKIYNK
mgnify:FL=1